MKTLLILPIFLVGVWFQGAEMRASPDLKLQYINMSGMPGYHLIHFGTGTTHFDEWIDTLVAAMPEGNELMMSCSSLRKCELAIDRLPDGVQWIAYDLEAWANSEGDDDDIQASVIAAAALAHAHGKRLMFIPCSKMMYDDNYWLIPIVAQYVDGWIIQGQLYELTEYDFLENVAGYHKLIVSGNPSIPILIQLRLNRYDWKGNIGWDPYFPEDTYTGIGLYEHYWLPVAQIFDGVLIADYADDNNPVAAWHRPGTYYWFAIQQRRVEYIGPVVIR